MKLKNLLPLREAKEEVSPELMATPFFRHFHVNHGYKMLFEYVGTKGEEHIFLAPINNFGMLDLIITKGDVIAKISEKEAVFGIVYTLSSLEKCDMTICKMKLKNGQVESLKYDSADKKNFDAKTTKFIDLLDNAK